MSADASSTSMFNVQNIYGTPQISRRQGQVVRPRCLTLIDLRNLAGSGEDGSQRKGSSGTIKSESGVTNLRALKQVSDISEPSRRSVSTIKVKSMSTSSQGFGVVGSGSQVKMEQTRFPKLEEYAHFHYDVLEIPTLKLSICADESSGYKHNIDLAEDSGMFLVTVTGSAPKSWLIKRSLENFATLDIQLHRCIFDRRFSHLDDLNTAQLVTKSRQEVQATLESYLSHLSELAGGMINCGSVLSWMEMDNRGHRLVATDDSGINTPAIAAAHVVKRYNAQAADEISLQVGDMISVIDMPTADDTIWWRGKRGFEVGFFPADCVEIIGDKVPTSMASRIPEPLATASAARRPCENLEEPSTTITATPSLSSTPSPSPSRYSTSTTSSLVGNLSMSSSSPESSPAMMKKHGKLLSFLRTFFSHRPPRNQLKQSGIVKERVFGCDLGEHLLNSGHDVPLLLKSCTDIIEEYGIVHGIYRLSGITSNIQKLRLAFDEDRVPDLTDDCYLQDIHSISSLLKMYFRELPNPLLTYQLYDKFADAVRDEDNKLLKIHDVVQQLPPPHYRTTEYLMRHLARVAAFGHETEMHSKNLAIVWAPNLLRSKELEAGGGAAALQGVGIQAVVTECLICYCDIIFSDKMPNYNSQDSTDGQKKARPKSLAISTPTRLLSLEEARERAFTGHLAPKKFIDVGGGPRNLPSQYHTVIDLPGYRKRAPSSTKENKPASGSKKMSTTCAGGSSGGGGWKSIFTKPRSGSIKKSRKVGLQDSVTLDPAPAKALTEEDVHNWKRHLRSAKSAESLFSLITTPSPHGSGINSRASFTNAETAGIDIPENFCGHNKDTPGKFQLSHKRSLSSDASTILHHRCSSKDAPGHSQTRTVDDSPDQQPFLRGDSTRKALHRRLPSAPNTPHLDRKPVNETSPEEITVNDEMSESTYSKLQLEGDASIDAKINSRLLQVAEKTRSAKSNEELTSPLKRLASSPAQGRKKAKGTGNFNLESSDDEHSPGRSRPMDRNMVHSSNDTSGISNVSPYDNSDEGNRLRMLYSHFHDYAEILSDDDMPVVRTPDSQGTMSVSSSGCNMQDVLDQIDTRLAMNAKLFPRQGIGDTSGYRVGDPAFSLETVDHPRSSDPSAGIGTGTSSTTCSTTTGRETEFSVTARGCPPETTATNSRQTEFSADWNTAPKELIQQSLVSLSTDTCPEFINSEGYDLDTRSSDHQSTDVEQKRSDGGSLRTSVIHKASGQTSTLVRRRHAEFIPSSTATAQDLQNLNDLLDSLERDDPRANSHNKTKVLQKSHRSTRDSGGQVSHDHHDSNKQKPPVSASSSHNFESKILALEAKVDGRLVSVPGSGGGMSKCLSVPSDIARSLENVTESQSDMLSSVTISELSVSINSFSNGLGQDSGSHADGVKVLDTDHRHRRSTSLDSLTESDHLMTRTLREINCQMEAAFKHGQMNHSDYSLDSLPNQQRLVASDLDLNSSPLYNANLKQTSQVDGDCVLLGSDNLLQMSMIDQSNILTQRSFHSPDALGNTPQQQHYKHSDVSSSPVSNRDCNLDLVSGEPAAACHVGSKSSTSLLENHTFPDMPLAASRYAELSPDYKQQSQQSLDCTAPCLLDGTGEQEDVNTRRVEDQQLNVGCISRVRERATDRQSDEHIVVEAAHVVRQKPSEVNRLKSGSQHYSHQNQTGLQNVPGRSDIANVCQNRSFSSSSSTSSEEFDEVANESHKDGDKSKPKLTLPLGNTSDVGRGRVDATACSQVVGTDSEGRRDIAALNVSVLSNDFTQYQVIRRQHSPRVEQRSPRSLKYNFSVGVTGAQYSKHEGEDESDDWKPSALFSSGSQMDENETCERMSSLCAAGLMSQRVRLSRESSISSLQSPDTCCPNILLASTQSPLSTPAKEALPDLIQSTTQIEGANTDTRRSSAPLQLALYHPDEFSMDIAASVSRYVPSSRSVAMHPSPSLPQVHSQSDTVVLEKSTLKKSSTDNYICEVMCPEIACHYNQVPENDQVISEGLRVEEDLQKENRDIPETDSPLVAVGIMSSEAGSYTNYPHGTGGRQDERIGQHRQNDVLGQAYTTSSSQLLIASEGNPNSEPVQTGNLYSTKSDDLGLPHQAQYSSHFSGTDPAVAAIIGNHDTNGHKTRGVEAKESEPSFTAVRRSSSRTDGESMEAEVFYGTELDKEVSQNVLNQGREMLLSPEFRDKSGQGEKSHESPPSPLTMTNAAGPVHRPSFSKIPRPRQNPEATSPRSSNSGGKRGDSSLHSSSSTPSAQMDTSPSSSSSSSSSSSASSSSRSGHIRRGSEVSSAASAKRQCHNRRSSDTKLTDLQTSSTMPRCQSSSTNKPDLSVTGRPVTSPRSRGSDNKTAATDIGGKSSRIPLSHRVPSPQSNRAADGSILGISKQHSKIPSPVPKPRKLSLTSKGSQSSEGTETGKQSSIKTDTTSKVSVGKGSAARKEADPSSKRSSIVIKDIPDKPAAKLVIESQTELKKAQTAHANRVSQPTRQVADNGPVPQSCGAAVQLDITVGSLVPGSAVNAQSQLQTGGEVRRDGGKKTPPPVAARKFHYDSRSLPRWSKFLESQISFSGQQSNSELYSDMLGSRSSLDDSVLQLAAERHDLFVPEITGDGRHDSHCLSLLRVKRSKKMQSLMDLFEHGSDLNITESSGVPNPGAQPRVRTFSGSTLGQEGQLTPCMEVGHSDDNTFLPLTFEGHDKWSRERFPSRTGAGPDESTQECLEGGGRIRTLKKSDASSYPSETQSQGKQPTRDIPQETEVISVSSILRTSAAERLNHQHSSSLLATASDLAAKNLRPPHTRSSPKSRTHSDSSSLESHTTSNINASSSRPSSFSGLDLCFQSCDDPLRQDISQASSYNRQHSDSASSGGPSDGQSEAANRHLASGQHNDSINKKMCDHQASEGSITGTPPPVARINSERRNSIKELRQLFERPDSDSSTVLTDIDPPSPTAQLPAIRSRVRSISPHTDLGHETKRDKAVRLSLEIPSSSVTCPSSQVEVKTQPLRLGPKPFYGAQK